MRNYQQLFLTIILIVCSVAAAAVEPVTVRHGSIPGGAQIVTNAAALYADATNQAASTIAQVHTNSDKIASVSSGLNATSTLLQQTVANLNICNAALNTHVADKSNPHAVTAAQIGAATTAALADEVTRATAAESANATAASNAQTSADGAKLAAADAASSAKSYTDSATNAVAFDGYDIVTDEPLIMANAYAYNRSLRSYHNTYKDAQTLNNYAFYYVGRCTNLVIDCTNLTWTTTTAFTGFGSDLPAGTECVISIPNFTGTLPLCFFGTESKTSVGYSLRATKILIPNVTHIPIWGFTENYNVREILLKNDVVFDNDYSFQKSTNLYSVGDISGVLNIRRYSFDQCSSLEKIGNVSSATNIDLYAFNGCSKLCFDPVFSSSLKSIGIGAFLSCPITNIVTWGGVTNVSDFAFGGALNIPLSIPSFTTNSLGGAIKFNGDYIFSGRGPVTARDGTTL